MNITLPKLYPHQIAVKKQLENSLHSGKIVCVKSRRQCGKTLVAIVLLIWFALTYKNIKIIFVSPTYRQISKVFNDLLKILEPISILVSKSSAQDFTVDFTNNSNIRFLSCASRENLRGYSCDFLIIDEAAFVSDDILSIVFPYVNVSNAPILLISTPRLREGLYYKYYQEGLDNKSNIVSIDWNNYNLDKFLSPQLLETYKKLLPKYQYENEVLGLFTDCGGGIFQFDPKELFYSKSESLECDKGYIRFGIDWAAGGGNDDTVLTCFNEQNQQIGLWYWNNLSPIEQVNNIANIILTYDKKRIKSVVAEQNSLGTPFISLLRERISIPITPFITSNSSKNEIIKNLNALINTNNIKLLDNEKQISEFNSYQVEITPSGAITYNAPQGLNDDIVLSCAICLSGNKKGKYNISF